MADKTLLLFAGMAVIPGLVILALHAKPRRSFSYAGAAVYLLAMIWTSHSLTPPRYLHVKHVGGIPVCDLYEADDDAITVASTLWSPGGENTFIQRTPQEFLDNGMDLLCLDNQAKKDRAGNLWALVVPLDIEGNPRAGCKPGYIPYRGDYVVETVAPGLPVEFENNPEFDSGAGRKRIEESNTIGFLDFGKDKFGRKFQHITWLGYHPVEPAHALPLNVAYEIGNGFESDLYSGHEYLGADFVCDPSLGEIPILATADGEIDGMTLNAYKSVTIRHNGSLWSHYGHLRRIASSLEAGRLHTGRKVKKGEIIGHITKGNVKDANGGKPYVFFTCFRKQGNGLYNPVDPLPILGLADYPPIPWANDEATFAQEEAEETTN
ncbi:MAG: M23 family metallopeptidase, partial [Patescibacteria group bacterium]